MTVEVARAMNEAGGQSTLPADSQANTTGGVERDGRVAALDGLRGLAVAAVVAYHLRLRGFEAGFLGVDLFFVISGFIITARLLQEHARAGAIDLTDFYRRRLWRLYPAALVLIVLAFPITAVVAPEALHRLAADAPAAFIYFSNWWQLMSAQPYFETMGRDPVLRHLWSLAVEQHYYLVWPLVMVLVLRHYRLRTLTVLALLLAAASTWEMARVYEADAVAANFTYLATHTHAMGLFVGSALGCLAFRFGWMQPGRPVAGPWVARAVLPLAGAASLAALGAMVIHWHAATPLLFEGGFLLVSLLAAVAITSAVVGDGWWPRLLGSAPLHWLGTRSYSIYLWHWPICVWVFDGPGDAGPVQAIAAVLLSAAAGELSYRFVEQRAREFVEHARMRISPFLTGLNLWIGTAAAVFAAQLAMPLLAPAPASPFATEPVPQATVAAAAQAAAPSATAPAAGAPPLEAGGREITIIGDSVMLGARDYFQRALPGVQVDAVVGRQFSEAPKLVAQLRARGALGHTVVLHLGTNGYIVENHFREVLRQLQDRRRVVVVDVHAARRWTEQNNEIVTRVAREFPNAVLVGWDAIGRENPDYFVKDGIHPTSAGISALASALARAAGATLFDVPTMARANVAPRAKSTRSLERRRATVSDSPAERAAPEAEGEGSQVP